MAFDIKDFAREVALGAASVSDFAKTNATALKLASQKREQIANLKLLQETASLFEIDTADRDECAVASDLADFFMSQFSWSREAPAILKSAPAKCRELWRSQGIEPSGLDAAVVESLAGSGDIAKSCLKCGVADGWVGSMIGAISRDILYGSPKPFTGSINGEMECKNFHKALQGDGIELVAGFSNELIAHMLGGRFRSGFKVFSDAITGGRIRGVVAVFGCKSDVANAIIARELIKQNILVINIGCCVVDLTKDGLLLPEAAQFAGESLQEMCEMTGMPPVLQMGLCYESIRFLILAKELLALGGLGENFSDMPIAAYCAQLGDRAAAIATGFAASGVYTIAGNFDLSTFRFPLSTVGDPVGAIISHIDSKRDALKINQQRERKLLDMKERRELE
jgi:hydroxylamine reductase (hybrid-cluster protein)